MSFPDTLLTEIPTDVATELVVLLSNEPVSAEMRRFLALLRGDVAAAANQNSLFEDIR